MVYLERIERNSNAYYYVTKNFRVDTGKWKKIRRYIGEHPPTKWQTKHAVEEIEKEALSKGLIKTLSKYEYVTDEEAEQLQDLKEVLREWYGKISEIGKKKYEEDFLVRFTYNSNAIEGNRLSLRETSMILTEDIIPANATPNDYNEAINSRDCMEFVKRYKGDLNQKFLLKVHRLLTKNTKCKMVGNYRNHDVRISGSEWVPPSHNEVKKEMKKVFHWYYYAKHKLHPVELAGVLHNKLVRTHPFTDGNGRTARVVVNWMLMKNKFPMFYSDVKEKTKYYAAIERGDKGDDGAIIHYLVQVLITQHTFRSKRSN